MTSAERAYRRLLRLLPADVRRDAEPELLDTFRGAYARAEWRGRATVLFFWARMLADVVMTAAAERGLRIGTPGRVLKSILGDIRPAARRLARTPVWTLASAFTLGIGLAASTVGIILVRDVLLRPLPFPEPDRLVRLVEISANGSGWWPSFPNASDWRAQARVFSGVGIGDVPQVQPVWIGDRAVRVPVSRAARGLFETLGVTPETGRWFSPDENRPGGLAAVVVSDRFWRSALGGRPLGDLAVTVGDERAPVVGVLPSSFRFLGEAGAWGSPADVWTPMDRADHLGSRSSHGYHVVARLAPGVTLERAQLEMNDLAVAIKAQAHEPTQADSVRLTPLKDVVTRSAREPLPWLLYAAVVVLGVACLNLAAAILAQGLTRGRELAVRLALGASRSTVARHLLVEAALLAAPGALVGLLLATLAVRLIHATAEHALPRLDELTIDPATLAVATSLAFATAFLAGLLPALTLSRANAASHLRSRGGIDGPRDQRRLWGTFVGAQVALTVLLVCAAGLLTRSFLAALSVDLGYDPRGVLAVDVTLPDSRYADAPRRAAYFDAALSQLRATPGVDAAGVTSVLPEDTTSYTSNTNRHEQAASTFAGYRVVDAGYFAAMGIPMLQGDERAFANQGSAIDRRLASVLWADRNPIGDRVDSGFSDSPLTVSNVVGTVREWQQAGDDVVGVVYVDLHRRPLSTMHLVVRSRVAPDAMAATVRDVFARVDPLVPVTIDRLDARATAGLSGRRLLLMLAVGFGAVALLLSVAGVNALVAFAVGRQKRESAIRLALGAPPASLRRRVFVRGVAPACVGIALGLAGFVPVSRAIRAQLFQVQPLDPLVISLAVLAVGVAASLASAIPARRASRVEPAAVLRAD